MAVARESSRSSATRGPRPRKLGLLTAVIGLAVLGAALDGPPAEAIEPAPTVTAAAAAPSASGVPSPLRVGITPNYPPIAFERDGTIVGIEPDLAAEVGKRLGVEAKLVPTAWDDLASALDGNEIDVVMSGVSVTDRRKRFVHFTDSYLKVGQMVLIRHEDQTKLSKPEAMNEKGARVGVERLTTGARYARDDLNRATIVEFDSVDAGIEALREKQVDFFIHDAPTVWRVTGRYPHADPALVGLYRPLTNEEIAWAVRKQDADTLGNALDRVLADMQSDGKVQEILDRWIPVRKVTKSATPVP
jgi:polar amino acid transport system substrate-binding protein